jgi:hypothetical protein
MTRGRISNGKTPFDSNRKPPFVSDLYISPPRSALIPPANGRHSGLRRTTDNSVAPPSSVKFHTNAITRALRALAEPSQRAGPSAGRCRLRVNDPLVRNELRRVEPAAPVPPAAVSPLPDRSLGWSRPRRGWTNGMVPKSRTAVQHASRRRSSVPQSAVPHHEEEAQRMCIFVFFVPG